MDYTDRLRRLAINDPRLADDIAERNASSRTSSIRRPWRSPASPRWSRSEAPSLRSARSPMPPSDAGASADEIVDVLVAIAPVVGPPSSVAAAPNVAMALGYDVDDAIESGRG